MEELAIDCHAGFQSPADTGMLCGILAPLLAVFNASAQSVLWFQPDFVDERFEMRGHGKLRFVPLRYFLVVAGFLLSPMTWRLGLELRGVAWSGPSESQSSGVKA